MKSNMNYTGIRCKGHTRVFNFCEIALRVRSLNFLLPSLAYGAGGFKMNPRAFRIIFSFLEPEFVYGPV